MRINLYYLGENLLSKGSIFRIFFHVGAGFQIKNKRIIDINKETLNQIDLHKLPGSLTMFS